MNPSKHKISVLTQIFKLIPGNLIPKLAVKYEADKQSRSFSPVSHVVSLLFETPETPGSNLSFGFRVAHPHCKQSRVFALSFILAFLCDFNF